MAVRSSSGLPAAISPSPGRYSAPNHVPSGVEGVDGGIGKGRELGAIRARASDASTVTSGSQAGMTLKATGRRPG